MLCKLLILACCFGSPAGAQSVTLRELLGRAEQPNRDLLAVRQRLEEAKGVLRQAGVAPATTLQAGGVSGRPVGTVGEEQFSAGFSKTFETGGKRDRRIEVAERQSEIATAEYEERLRQLRYDLRTRFVELVSSTRRLEVLDAQLSNLQSALELTRARVAQGDAAILESDLLSVEIGRIEVQRAELAGSAEAVQVELTRTAGLSTDEAVFISPTYSIVTRPYTAPDLISRALEDRADLRIARIREKQGDAEQRLAQAESHANVSVTGGYAFVKSRFDDQFGTTRTGAIVPLRDRDDVLSVSISIPLFSRSRNQGNIEASVARTRGSQYQREALERAIPLEVSAALRRLQSREQALTTLSGPVLDQASKNVEVIRQAYQLGQLRLLDVLNEQRRLLDLQLAKVDAEVEVLRSLTELEKAVGGELQ
jgi:cobalt-zinc-cadmium efflux system outer membrane protein